MSTPRQLREQTQIGTDVARSPEAFGFVDGGDERERSQLTDPGYCHQPLAGPDERARRPLTPASFKAHNARGRPPTRCGRRPHFQKGGGNP